MVDNLAFAQDININDDMDIQEEHLKWCTVSLAEMISRGKRLDATVFDVKAKHAREIVQKSKWEKVYLTGEDNIVERAFYPGRFKRIYCKRNEGIPFYLPSQMTDVYPKSEKFISANTKCSIDELKMKYGDILLTRSGTVGNLTVVTKTLENKVFSDDVIRITLKDKRDVGFLYAYLKSDIGNIILQTNRYGSVVTHLEPEHLQDVIIPNPDRAIKDEINNLIMGSFELRDESNKLLDQAKELMIEELHLPDVEKFVGKKVDSKSSVNNFSVKLSDLNARLDASYHIPEVEAIKEHLSKYSKEILFLGDERLSNKVLLPGRFKRVYVEEGQGRVFFGGKQIYELDPSNKKYLSVSQHSGRIKKELEILQNTILITRSGTIGKVAIAPKHWEHWIINEHVIRVFPKDDKIAGYLYVFLSSEYGYELITRFTYGSVVDEIDANHVSNIPIPILKDQQVQDEINRLAILANQKRYKAYKLEMKAMKELDEKVIYYN